MINKELKVNTNNKSESSTKLLPLTVLGVLLSVLVIGGIILLVIMQKNKTLSLRNYTNPFARQESQTMYQNPFSTPTTSYQNPFSTNTSQQETNKPYQNPFSGGQ